MGIFDEGFPGNPMDLNGDGKTDFFEEMILFQMLDEWHTGSDQTPAPCLDPDNEFADDLYGDPDDDFDGDFGDDFDDVDLDGSDEW